MEHAKNPYEGASNSRRSVVAIVVLGVLMVAAFAAVAYFRNDDMAALRRMRATSGAYQEQYVPGQPLDAVRLKAPSWSDQEWMYRVGDRTSGACWYRVHVDGRWEVYLICEGRSYVDQQLKSEVGK